MPYRFLRTWFQIGIAAAVIDPVNQSEFFDEVAERVEFITMDTDAPDSKRKVFIGVDN